MSDYPMLISNKLHSFRNFSSQSYIIYSNYHQISCHYSLISLEKPRGAKFQDKFFRSIRKNLTLVQFFRGEILSVINIKLNG